jgi:inhibitor of cysteine peptidase
MKTFKLLASALTALLFAGCATTNNTKTLTSFDSGKQATVTVGQVFVVELPSNPTTGFRWNYQQDGEPVVEQVGEPSYLLGPSPVGMMGGGGTETWTFRATKEGRETLRLEYARPWEKDAAPVQTIVFKLVVAGESH